MGVSPEGLWAPSLMYDAYGYAQKVPGYEMGQDKSGRLGPADYIQSNRTLARSIPLDIGRRVYWSAIHYDGTWARLPAEVMHKVTRHLDIASVMALRQVNKKTLELLEGTLEFKKVSMGTVGMSTVSP
jgi:hypothetical protein